MKQWTESGITSYLSTLAKNDAHDIADILFHIAELDHSSQPDPLPTGTAQVITYLEQLIEDHRGYIIMRTRTTFLWASCAG